MITKYKTTKHAFQNIYINHDLL